MVKSWVKFNESKESLSKEMAEEIIFYFGENCYPNSEIENIYDNLYKDFNLGYTLYESGYEEMKSYGQILYNRAKEDAKLGKKLIDIYNLIRKDISIFPEFYKIEDIYLNLIEGEKFGLSIEIESEDPDPSCKLYTIVLTRYGKLDEFIKFCNVIKSSLPRIQSNKYKTKIVECEYSIGNIKFKIELDPH